MRNMQQPLGTWEPSQHLPDDKTKYLHGISLPRRKHIAFLLQRPSNVRVGKGAAYTLKHRATQGQRLEAENFLGL
jgi:hypothetical protein